MRDIDLFQMPLGLTPPWQVSSSEFDLQRKRLDIGIDFPRGSTFTCPECGQADIKAYDTQEKSWRHLNFFQHEARDEADHSSVRKVAMDETSSKRGHNYVSLFVDIDGPFFSLQKAKMPLQSNVSNKI